MFIATFFFHRKIPNWINIRGKGAFNSFLIYFFYIIFESAQGGIKGQYGTDKLDNGGSGKTYGVDKRRDRRGNTLPVLQDKRWATVYMLGIFFFSFRSILKMTLIIIYVSFCTRFKRFQRHFVHFMYMEGGWGWKGRGGIQSSFMGFHFWM